MTQEEKETIRTAFANVVNMTPAAIEHWLETADSQRLRAPLDADASGRLTSARILALKRKRTAELTSHDYVEMWDIVTRLSSRLVQRVPDDAVHDRRYLLMNWGHDPLR